MDTYKYITKQKNDIEDAINKCIAKQTNTVDQID